VSRRFAFLALLAAFLALPGLAADADFHKRTGTKPPAGEFLAGFDFTYMDEISPTLKFGWRHKETGVMVVGGLTALRIDAQKGESPFTVGCQDFLVPYSTGSHTRAVYQIGVLFPLRTLARPAK